MAWPTAWTQQQSVTVDGLTNCLNTATVRKRCQLEASKSYELWTKDISNTGVRRDLSPFPQYRRLYSLSPFPRGDYPASSTNVITGLLPPDMLQCLPIDTGGCVLVLVSPWHTSWCARSQILHCPTNSCCCRVGQSVFRSFIRPLDGFTGNFPS
jgi:hypothetical protein